MLAPVDLANVAGLAAVEPTLGFMKAMQLLRISSWVVNHKTATVRIFPTSFINVDHARSMWESSIAIDDIFG